MSHRRCKGLRIWLWLLMMAASMDQEGDAMLVGPGPVSFKPLPRNRLMTDNFLPDMRKGGGVSSVGSSRSGSSHRNSRGGGGGGSGGVSGTIPSPVRTVPGPLPNPADFTATSAAVPISKTSGRTTTRFGAAAGVRPYAVYQPYRTANFGNLFDDQNINNSPFKNLFGTDIGKTSSTSGPSPGFGNVLSQENGAKFSSGMNHENPIRQLNRDQSVQINHPFSSIRLTPVNQISGISVQQSPGFDTSLPYSKTNDKFLARNHPLFSSVNRAQAYEQVNPFEKPIRHGAFPLPDVTEPITLDLAGDEQQRVLFLKQNRQLPPSRNFVENLRREPSPRNDNYRFLPVNEDRGLSIPPLPPLPSENQGQGRTVQNKDGSPRNFRSNSMPSTNNDDAVKDQPVRNEQSLDSKDSRSDNSPVVLESNEEPKHPSKFPEQRQTHPDYNRENKSKSNEIDRPSYNRIQQNPGRYDYDTKSDTRNDPLPELDQSKEGRKVGEVAHNAPTRFSQPDNTGSYSHSLEDNPADESYDDNVHLTQAGQHLNGHNPNDYNRNSHSNLNTDQGIQSVYPENTLSGFQKGARHDDNTQHGDNKMADYFPKGVDPNHGNYDVTVVTDEKITKVPGRVQEKSGEEVIRSDVDGGRDPAVKRVVERTINSEGEKVVSTEEQLPTDHIGFILTDQISDDTNYNGYEPESLNHIPGPLSYSNNPNLDADIAETDMDYPPPPTSQGQSTNSIEQNRLQFPKFSPASPSSSFPLNGQTSAPNPSKSNPKGNNVDPSQISGNTGQNLNSNSSVNDNLNGINNYLAPHIFENPDTSDVGSDPPPAVGSGYLRWPARSHPQYVSDGLQGNGVKPPSDDIDSFTDDSREFGVTEPSSQEIGEAMSNGYPSPEKSANSHLTHADGAISNQKSQLYSFEPNTRSDDKPSIESFYTNDRLQSNYGDQAVSRDSNGESYSFDPGLGVEFNDEEIVREGNIPTTNSRKPLENEVSNDRKAFGLDKDPNGLLSGDLLVPEDNTKSTDDVATQTTGVSRDDGKRSSPINAGSGIFDRDVALENPDDSLRVGIMREAGGSNHDTQTFDERIEEDGKEVGEREREENSWNERREGEQYGLGENVDESLNTDDVRNSVVGDDFTNKNSFSRETDDHEHINLDNLSEYLKETRENDQMYTENDDVIRLTESGDDAYQSVANDVGDKIDENGIPNFNDFTYESFGKTRVPFLEGDDDDDDNDNDNDDDNGDDGNDAFLINTDPVSSKFDILNAGEGSLSIRKVTNTFEEGNDDDDDDEGVVDGLNNQNDVDTSKKPTRPQKDYKTEVTPSDDEVSPEWSRITSTESPEEAVEDTHDVTDESLEGNLESDDVKEKLETDREEDDDTQNSPSDKFFKPESSYEKYDFATPSSDGFSAESAFVQSDQTSSSGFPAQFDSLFDNPRNKPETGSGSFRSLFQNINQDYLDSRNLGVKSAFQKGGGAKGFSGVFEGRSSLFDRQLGQIVEKRPSLRLLSRRKR